MFVCDLPGLITQKIYVIFVNTKCFPIYNYYFI